MAVHRDIIHRERAEGKNHKTNRKVNYPAINNNC